MSLSSGVLLIPVVFGIWITVIHAVAVTYLVLTVQCRDHFEVKVRSPSLTIVEVLSLQLCSTTVCLREIAAATGWALPAEVQVASFVALTTIHVIFIPLRCLQLLVIFDPSIRKRYGRHFKTFKRVVWGLLVLFTVSLYIILASDEIKGCLRR